jgi:predicted enzyme related to lactoylglutathione lyase
MSGRVVHFEIPFDDGDRAREFYAKAFGWNITHVPDMDYTLVSTGPTSQEQGPTEPGYIGGGMLQRSELSRAPVITVDVDDIDATLAKVEQLGGKVVRPKAEVGQMGFSAYFNDPEGNLTGLWQNAPING